MRGEVRWVLIALIALLAGVTCAEPYSRAMCPYYAAVARFIAKPHPWAVREITVRKIGPGAPAEVRLVGIVWSAATHGPSGPIQGLRVETELGVGGVIQVPVLFWGVVVAWRAGSRREWLVRWSLGAVIFFALEILTTVCQLVAALAQASAYLAAVHGPVTPWELWSRFLESGGRQALAVAAALITVAIAAPGEPVRLEQLPH